MTVNQGESPLHTACQRGLVKLTEVLLEKGANPNSQTKTPLDHSEDQVYKQTPLHVAISNRHEDIVKVFLDYKGDIFVS